MLTSKEYKIVCSRIVSNIFITTEIKLYLKLINIIEKYGIYLPEYCKQYEDDTLYLDEPPDVIISVMYPIFLLIRNILSGSKSKNKKSRFGDSLSSKPIRFIPIDDIKKDLIASKDSIRSRNTILDLIFDDDLTGTIIDKKTLEMIKEQEKKCGESFPDYCQCYLNDLDDESDEANWYRALYPLLLTIRDNSKK